MSENCADTCEKDAELQFPSFHPICPALLFILSTQIEVGGWGLLRDVDTLCFCQLLSPLPHPVPSKIPSFARMKM